MKVCRASSFQKRSSDVPEPLLPLTQEKHTHTHIVHKTTRLERGGGRSEGKKGGGRRVGSGGVVTGAEEDAVPLHPNTLQLYSDHRLTALFKCSCLLRGFWTVSVWGCRERERAGFSVTDQ